MFGCQSKVSDSVRFRSADCQSKCLSLTGLDRLVVSPKPEWLLQIDVSE